MTNDTVTIAAANVAVRRSIASRAKQLGRISKAGLIDQVLDLLFGAIKLADKFAGVPGVKKKQWVLLQIEQLVDKLLPMIPVPWFLAPFRPWLLTRAKAEIMELADAAVETILRNIREAAEAQ